MYTSIPSGSVRSSEAGSESTSWVVAGPSLCVMTPACLSTPNRGRRPHTAGVWVGVRRESVQVDPVRSVLYPLAKRFELVALKLTLLVLVVELNDDAVFLYVGDAGSLVQARRDECRPIGKVVEERPPTHAEGHT